jgi:hypothetical protein
MLNRYLTSTFLAAAVVSAGLMGCNNSNDTTPTASTPGPAQRTGAAVDNAARTTADNARDAANRTGNAVDRAADRAANAANNAADRTAAGVNNAADRAANAANNAATDTHTFGTTGNTGTTGTTANNQGNTNSNVPGLPSVTGTSTTGMSTADAAAQRLIDNARNNIKQNDLSKAKTLLSELKDKGMYDSLSSAQKANVDKLEQEINAAPGATAQENK